MSSTPPSTSPLATLTDALASGAVRVVDLTQPLSESTPVLRLPEPFANTPGLRRTEISRYDDRGPAWYWNDIQTSEHTGTHFDAPVHWVTGADLEDVAQVPAARLPAQGSVVIAGPLPITGGSGSPCRALALVES